MMLIPAGLNQAFQNAEMSLTSDHSSYITDGSVELEMIENIVSKALYTPISRPEKLEGRWIFTIVPFQIPHSFGIENVVFNFCYNAASQTKKIFMGKKFLEEDHYQNNRREILDLLDQYGYKIRNALILGPGHCDDIPLERIVNHCKEVTLMELDRKTMNETIGRLPLSLQKKVTPVVCDLSGLITFFQAALHKMPSNLTAIDALKYYFKNAVESLNHKTPLPIPGKFDLVISSMVLNQFHAMSLKFFNDQIRLKKLAIVDDPEYRNRGHDPDHICENALAFDHFHHLRKLTAPEGLIYFSDQFFLTETSRVGATLKEKETLTIQPPLIMVEAFPAGLKVLKKGPEWKWDMRLPVKTLETGEEEYGARMRIRSYILRK
jgi:hypothetical protein